MVINHVSKSWDDPPSRSRKLETVQPGKISVNDGFFSIKKNPLFEWPKNLTSWWFFTTHLKNMLVKKRIISPRIGVKIKNIWNHHLAEHVFSCPLFIFDHPWRVLMEQKIPWHLDLEVLLLASPQRSFDSFFDSRIHTWFQSGKGTL